MSATKDILSRCRPVEVPVTTALARACDVDPVTVRRWAKQGFVPPRHHLAISIELGDPGVVGQLEADFLAAKKAAS